MTAIQPEDIGGIKVYSEIQMIPITKVTLNYWNPNFCPTSIEKAIEDDIRKNGFLDPIIVQKHNTKMNMDYVIINGEHRFKILTKLITAGVEHISPDTSIPATIIDCDDSTAMALTVRLNREHGELVPNKVGKIINELSPSQNVEYLQDLLFLEPQELVLLAKLTADNTKEELEREQQQQSQDQDQKQRKKEARVIRGIIKVECPQCHAIVDVPR